MRVTVAIATWNRAASLARTLASLCSLSPSTIDDWEVVVVNNACTDATDDVVRGFEGRLPVRLLHEPTPGKSRACNRAIAEARGEFLLWTDDDTVVDSGWVAGLTSALSRHDADFVFGRSIPLWPGREPAWYDSSRFAGYFAALDLGPEDVVIRDRAQSFYGLNYGGRRRAFVELGGLRSDFGFRGERGGVGEDTDLFERAFDHGMKIVYTPEAVVEHVIPDFRVDKRYHRRRHWVANEVYYTILPEVFPDVPWAFGLPRFFYAKAARDVFGYCSALVRRSASDQFHHEMQLVRFARLLLETFRHGLRRPRPVSPDGGHGSR